MSTVLKNSSGDNTVTASSENTSFSGDSTVTASEPEPKKPEVTAPEPTKKPCNLHAKGELDGPIATMDVEEKSKLECDRTQVIYLDQGGRRFTYTRTGVTTAPEKKEE